MLLTSACLKAFCVRVAILSAGWGAGSPLDLTLILQLSAMEEWGRRLQSLLLGAWAVLVADGPGQAATAGTAVAGLGDGARLPRSKAHGAECH